VLVSFRIEGNRDAGSPLEYVSRGCSIGAKDVVLVVWRIRPWELKLRHRGKVLVSPRQRLVSCYSSSRLCLNPRLQLQFRLRCILVSTNPLAQGSVCRLGDRSIPGTSVSAYSLSVGSAVHLSASLVRWTSYCTHIQSFDSLISAYHLLSVHGLQVPRRAEQYESSDWCPGLVRDWGGGGV
jgi:hypothetical protein